MTRWQDFRPWPPQLAGWPRRATRGEIVALAQPIANVPICGAAHFRHAQTSNTRTDRMTSLTGFRPSGGSVTPPANRAKIRVTQSD